MYYKSVRINILQIHTGNIYIVTIYGKITVTHWF